MLTGISPARSGVVSNESRPTRDSIPEVVSLVKAFRNACYDTACYGQVFHEAQRELADWDEFRSAISAKATGVGTIKLRLHGLNLVGKFDWGPLAVNVNEVDEPMNVNNAIPFLSRRTSNDAKPFFPAPGLFRCR